MNFCEGARAPRTLHERQASGAPCLRPPGAGHGLAYATSIRGGDHVYGYLVTPDVLGSHEKLDPCSNAGKAEWVKTFQDLTVFIDSSGSCLFTSFPLGATVSAVTVYEIYAEEVLRIGERT